MAFNLCGFTTNQHKCEGDQDFGTLAFSDTCKSLTGNSLSNVKKEYYDKSNHTAGIVLTYSPGAKCAHSDAEFYQLSVAVVCDQDKEISEEVKIDTQSLITPCTPRVLVYSSKGCPTLEINPLFQWMHLLRYGLGPLVGIIGLFFMFLSLKALKYAYFLIGFCATPVFLVGFLYAVCIPDDSKVWIVTIPIAFSLVIGAVVGTLCYKYHQLPIILAGFFGMYVVHLAIFVFITHRFTDETTATVVFWCQLFFLCILGAILGYLIFPVMYLLSTTLVGAYLFFR